ncbi:MAG: erythromycin esterase family protein [Bryobacterales bacterium]|nr:erythromycin esterase family protein [Bryobacterales bacterium]
MLRRTFPAALLGGSGILAAAPRDPVLDFISRHSVAIGGSLLDPPKRSRGKLRKILSGVRVLGAGECNHGTSEFQVFKDRLFRFLVEEMGFTIFALEASFSACKALNQYILTGQGERDAVLAAQGYTVWDTVEMAGQVEWMRRYNQTAAANRKVQLAGLDLAYTAASRANVLAWLRSRDPVRAAAAEQLFRPMIEIDEKWPRRNDPALGKNILADVQALARFVRETGRGAPETADPMTDPIWDMDVIEQCVQQAAGVQVRNQAMGANMLRLLDRYPEAKAMVSAFNSHLAADGPERLGSRLRQRLGKAYYVMAAEFGTGSFHTRVVDDDLAWSRFHVLTPPAPPERSVPWYFQQARKGSVFLPLGEAPPAARSWLDEPQMMHQTGWALIPDPAWPRYAPQRALRSYDGVFFVERIRPTQPTASAMEAARQRLRF